MRLVESGMAKANIARELKNRRSKHISNFKINEIDLVQILKNR